MEILSKLPLLKLDSKAALEENTIDTFIQLLKAYLRDIRFEKQQDYSYRKNKEIMKLFDRIFENFEKTSSPMCEWKDRYGMTLLMNMVITAEDRKHMRQLVELIIKNNYFNDSYLNLKAEYELTTQFELQHFEGSFTETKGRNTRIAPCQKIAFKKILKKGNDGWMETFDRMKDNQMKMVSKGLVRLLKPIQWKGKE